jgi:hypothetical protein
MDIQETEGRPIERRRNEPIMHEERIVDSRLSARRAYRPWISWAGIFGGLVSGLGVYMTLALLGVAIGLTAINPQAAEPVGQVPLFTGIWTAISLIASAFVGGFVAARISGLTRKSDGMMHGLVAWGVSAIIFAYLISTSVGALLGGTMGILGQAAQAVTGGAVTVSQSPAAQSSLENLLKGAGGGNITRESLSTLQGQLSAGDRNGAINTMVNQMGFTRERATTLVDRGMAIYGQAPETARDIASTAVSGLSAASWSLFIGLLLSLGLSIYGGTVGSHSALRRRNAISTAH